MMIGILAGGSLAAVAICIAVWLRAATFRSGPALSVAPPIDHALRRRWRMPPLASLAPRRLGAGERTWLVVLRAYLLVAAGLVLARIVGLAIGVAAGG
jgi:hypothetical protein